MTALDATSNLLNIAEISAAFAGFAALVSVLRQRGTRADALHDILRLRVVISTSMVVVVAALIFNICQAAFVFVRFVGSEFSAREVL